MQPNPIPISVSLNEFRANESAMIKLVEKSEAVCISRHGMPVVEPVPMQAAAAQKVPRWKMPVEPLNYLKAPSKSGAQMIVAEREGGW